MKRKGRESWRLMIKDTAREVKEVERRDFDTTKNEPFTCHVIEKDANPRVPRYLLLAAAAAAAASAETLATFGVARCVRDL